MHTYASDSGNRSKVYWFSALAAMAVAALFLPLTQELSQPFRSVPLPSGFAIFGILIKVFDSWLWKITPVRMLFGIETPDLSGVWEGTLTTSYDDHQVEHSVRLTVKQTWTRISIKGEFKNSRSESTTAAVVTVGRADPVLIYGFTNKPNASATRSMTTHSGTAELYYENQSLLGGYFTSRDRENHGGMKLVRK